MTRFIAIFATIAFFLALGSGAADAAVQQPERFDISIVADTSTCGQVTLTARGYGLTSGWTQYQLVADRTAKAVTIVNGTLAATFTLAQAGEWGNAWIRTSAGGYLRTQFVAYHVARCA